ncbi:MAG: hypothetical protein AB8U53_06130 [Rickettsia aeschlimannii]
MQDQYDLELAEDEGWKITEDRIRTLFYGKLIIYNSILLRTQNTIVKIYYL